MSCDDDDVSRVFTISSYLFQVQCKHQPTRSIQFFVANLNHHELNAINASRTLNKVSRAAIAQFSIESAHDKRFKL